MAYAVVLQPNVPQQLLSLLADNVRDSKQGAHFFFATHVDPSSYFVECAVVRGSRKQTPWKVQIPLSYILAISEVGAGKPGPNFLQSQD